MTWFVRILHFAFTIWRDEIALPVWGFQEDEEIVLSLF